MLEVMQAVSHVTMKLSSILLRLRRQGIESG